MRWRPRRRRSWFRSLHRTQRKHTSTMKMDTLLLLASGSLIFLTIHEDALVHGRDIHDHLPLELSGKHLQPFSTTSTQPPCPANGSEWPRNLSSVTVLHMRMVANSNDQAPSPQCCGPKYVSAMKRGTSFLGSLSDAGEREKETKVLR